MSKHVAEWEFRILIAVLLCNLYGRAGYHQTLDHGYPPRGEVQNYDHGWPFRFLRRHAGRGAYEPGSLPFFDPTGEFQTFADSYSDASSVWPIDDAEWLYFSWWKLLANIGVVAVAATWCFLGFFHNNSASEEEATPSGGT